MPATRFRRPDRASFLAALMLITGALALAGCQHVPPDVTKTVSYDDKGRQVVSYRICERNGLPVVGETACRTETVIRNYCYRTIGNVECYEKPIPGRTALRVAD